MENHLEPTELWKFFMPLSNFSTIPHFVFLRDLYMAPFSKEGETAESLGTWGRNGGASHKASICLARAGLGQTAV